MRKRSPATYCIRPRSQQQPSTPMIQPKRMMATAMPMKPAVILRRSVGKQGAQRLVPESRPRGHGASWPWAEVGSGKATYTTQTGLHHPAPSVEERAPGCSYPWVQKTGQDSWVRKHRERSSSSLLALLRHLLGARCSTVLPEHLAQPLEGDGSYPYPYLKMD